MFVYLMDTDERWHSSELVYDDTRSREKGDSMNFDPGQLTQLLSRVPYPIGKAQLVQFAQQHGANEQIIGLLQRLPEKTFNSSQEVQDSLGGLGNLGGFKL